MMTLQRMNSQKKLKQTWQKRLESLMKDLN